MKKLTKMLASTAMLVGLAACGKASGPSWQSLVKKFLANQGLDKSVVVDLPSGSALSGLKATVDSEPGFFDEVSVTFTGKDQDKVDAAWQFFADSLADSENWELTYYSDETVMASTTPIEVISGKSTFEAGGQYCEYLASLTATSVEEIWDTYIISFSARIGSLLSSGEAYALQQKVEANYGLQNTMFNAEAFQVASGYYFNAFTADYVSTGKKFAAELLATPDFADYTDDSSDSRGLLYKDFAVTGDLAALAVETEAKLSGLSGWVLVSDFEKDSEGDYAGTYEYDGKYVVEVGVVDYSQTQYNCYSVEISIQDKSFENCGLSSLSLVGDEVPAEETTESASARFAAQANPAGAVIFDELAAVGAPYRGHSVESWEETDEESQEVKKCDLKARFEDDGEGKFSFASYSDTKFKTFAEGNADLMTAMPGGFTTELPELSGVEVYSYVKTDEKTSEVSAGLIAYDYFDQKDSYYGYLTRQYIALFSSEQWSSQQVYLSDGQDGKIVAMQFVSKEVQNDKLMKLWVWTDENDESGNGYLHVQPGLEALNPWNAEKVAAFVEKAGFYTEEGDTKTPTVVVPAPTDAVLTGNVWSITEYSDTVRQEAFDKSATEFDAYVALFDSAVWDKVENGTNNVSFMSKVTVTDSQTGVVSYIQVDVSLNAQNTLTVDVSVGTVFNADYIAALFAAVGYQGVDASALKTAFEAGHIDAHSSVAITSSAIYIDFTFLDQDGLNAVVAFGRGLSSFDIGGPYKLQNGDYVFAAVTEAGGLDTSKPYVYFTLTGSVQIVLPRPQQA
jgi:hypothetical protein